MKCLPCLFLLITTSLHAQVIFDGTLGPSVNLPGPNYQIESQYGQQYGGNLFHSFQEFNLQNHESATFSGHNNVQFVYLSGFDALSFFTLLIISCFTNNKFLNIF